MLARVLKRQVVLWQLLCLEWLLQASLAQGAEGKSLLLNFDEAALAESVATVQVARNAQLPVKILVARWALHGIYLHRLGSQSTKLLLIGSNYSTY